MGFFGGYTQKTRFWVCTRVSEPCSASNYKMYKFDLCVSPLPDKTKATETAHFEVNCHSILILNSKHELRELYFY